MLRRAAVVAGRRPPFPALEPHARSARRSRRSRRCCGSSKAGAATAGADGLRGRALDRSRPRASCSTLSSSGCSVCRCCWSITFRPEFSAALDRPGARDDAGAQSARSRATSAALVQQIAAATRPCCRGGRRRDRRAHRRRAAVRRGADQGGAGRPRARIAVHSCAGDDIPPPRSPCRRRCMPR